MRYQKSWTKEEEQKLRELALVKCREDVAKEMGRSIHSVFSKAQALGLSFKIRSAKAGRNWTKADDRELLFLSDSKTQAQIAKALGRTTHAIGQRAMDLSIRLSARRMTLEELAKLLGAHKQTIIRGRDLLGLRFRSYAKGYVRGPTDEDIVALAKWLLNNPKGRHKSQKLLLQVISDYSLESYESEHVQHQ